MTDETIAIGPYPEGLGYSRAPRAAARHMLRPLTRLRLAGWGLFACSMFVPPLLLRSGVVGWQGTASARIITGAALCGLVLIIVEMLLRRRWAARAMAAHYTPGGALSLDGEGRISPAPACAIHCSGRMSTRWSG
ncbi:hypothetical protein FDP22_06440 [Paroceanicella profunda]|uniref:Uncharacterized protein n=1 Tax=Paroceanicella profunda TaxID=2579971 RepID=A0A5B8FVQ1_9RHOB|nr:hypothetical protein [Paroceanicella profunda]QDL91454.1 hypothetical protein FDP22_06440 [Paroceanicella profunda]